MKKCNYYNYGSKQPNNRINDWFYDTMKKKKLKMRKCNSNNLYIYIYIFCFFSGVRSPFDGVFLSNVQRVRRTGGFVKHVGSKPLMMLKWSNRLFCGFDLWDPGGCMIWKNAIYGLIFSCNNSRNSIASLCLWIRFLNLQYLRMSTLRVLVNIVFTFVEAERVTRRLVFSPLLIIFDVLFETFVIYIYCFYFFFKFVLKFVGMACHAAAWVQLFLFILYI